VSAANVLPDVLGRLKLTAIRDRLDTLLDDAAGRELSLRETLALLCDAEVARREERRIQMGMSIAKFPFVVSDRFPHGREVLTGGSGLCCGLGFDGWRLPGPRHEFIDAAVGPALDDFGEDVGDIGLGVDAEHFAGLDDRGRDGPMGGAAVISSKQAVLSGQAQGAQSALDGIAVDLHAPVIKEAGQADPVVESVVDGLIEIRTLQELGFGLDQPLVEAFHERRGALPSRVLTGGRRAASDLVLDCVEGADASDGLFRLRC
jgi:hypothetical protein